MILGLDISTTMVGAALIDPSTRQLRESIQWDIKNKDSLFEKSEAIGAELYTLRSLYDITDIFVEVDIGYSLIQPFLVHY
jgi:sugar (pentulose or hexulose) kinase